MDLEIIQLVGPAAAAAIAVAAMFLRHGAQDRKARDRREDRRMEKIVSGWQVQTDRLLESHEATQETLREMSKGLIEVTNTIKAHAAADRADHTSLREAIRDVRLELRSSPSPRISPARTVEDVGVDDPNAL